MAIVLATLTSLTTTTFADVQNIRIGGDIRIRAYELIDTGPDNAADESFISQRTLISCEADLEDHVLVVATLRAEGLWGVSDESFEASSGAGTGLFGSGRVNRGTDVGINEAYVQLNELFYSPATLKLGRQYLHYGRGLILSNVEQEYNYDAARLVLDYYPLVVDIVYAKLAEAAFFGAPFGPTHDIDMIFVNGRYEMADSVLKDIEGYIGYQITSGVPAFEPPSPIIIGVRADLNFNENLQGSIEAAYETGSGAGPTEPSLSAFLINTGVTYTLADSHGSPSFNFNYTYASGGAPSSGDNFVPWFDYVDGYNGYLFAPALANIHIFNVGASMKVYENTTLALQAYYYLKADDAGAVSGNGNIDFGGIDGFAPFGSDSEVGSEIDVILGYDYSKDVRLQLIYAAFVPGTGIHGTSSFDSVAQEFRGEVNVKF